MTRLACLLFSAYALAVLAWFPRWTVDDAYITARYAENLALRGELNWNPGEDPVEGYTGIALPVILAGAIKLGLDPLPAAKAIGFASLFLAAGFAFAAARKFGAAPGVAAAAFGIVLAAPFMFTHAGSGLETTLFSAALIGSILAAVAALEAEERRARAEAVLAAALLATALIRPEGALLAAILSFAVACERTRESGGALRGWMLRTAAILILPGLCYFLWRWNYYGRLLPNTFYAKAHGGGLNSSSLRSMGLFVSTYLAMPALAAAILFFCGRSGPAARPMRARVIAAASALFVALAWLQYARSEMIMNYSYRFFAPYFPILVVLLAAAAAARLGAAPMDNFRSFPFAARAALAACALAQAGIYASVLPREAADATEYRQVLEDEHLQAAELLRHAAPENAWLAAIMDAGAVPYRTRLKTIDFGRLNDERLARREVSESDAVEYFFERRPEAAVFTSREWETLSYTPEAEAITRDPRFAEYVLVERYRSNRTNIRQRYFQFVYLRRDAAEGARREIAEVKLRQAPRAQALRAARDPQDK